MALVHLLEPHSRHVLLERRLGLLHLRRGRGDLLDVVVAAVVNRHAAVGVMVVVLEAEAEAREQKAELRSGEEKSRGTHAEFGVAPLVPPRSSPGEGGGIAGQG